MKAYWISFMMVVIILFVMEQKVDSTTNVPNNDTTEINESSVQDELMTKERFKEVMKFIEKVKLYDYLQAIIVKYVMHFTSYNEMTMKTKYGKKTIPISDEIKLNLTLMVHHSIHLEYTKAASKDKKFPYYDPVAVYQLIRNNTIVMDKIIDHMNGSFNKHQEVENPAKISAYNKLRTEPNFFRDGELNNSMEVLLQGQMKANLSVHDIASGNLHGNTSTLNAEESSHLAEFAYNRNLSYSVLFYEAALARFDEYEKESHFPILINKTQVLNKMIQLYNQYGEPCLYRVEQLEDIKTQEIEKEIELRKKEIEDARFGIYGKKGNDSDNNVKTDNKTINNMTDNGNQGNDIETGNGYQGDIENETDNQDDDIETVTKKTRPVSDEDIMCVQHIINQVTENDRKIHDEL